VIREEFSNSVVLTIAHRLATVITYDKILVVDAGKIAEFDHAHVLLEDPESLLSSMVQQVGRDAAYQLRDAAREAWMKQK
jgi:ABC-type multidrug transport system fused ATPase/permease subunit